MIYNIKAFGKALLQMNQKVCMLQKNKLWNQSQNYFLKDLYLR